MHTSRREFLTTTLAAAAPLRIWTPAEPPAEPEQQTREERARRRRDERRQWTLRQLYRRHVWPKVLKPRVLRGRLDATTVGKPNQDGEGGHMGAALKRWEELMPDDPSLDQIAVGADDPPDGFVDATEFAALLGGAEWRGKAITPATIERHTRYVQQILDCSGPDRRRGRELIRGARALLRREIPCVLYRHEQRAALPPYTLEQLWTWIELVRADPGNHGQRSWTDPIDPAAWHEALLLFLLNTGARPKMTLFISREMLRGEWLCVPARYVKGKRRDLEIYLNPPVRAALEKIDYRAARDRIFPWRGWPDSKPRLYEVVRDQLQRAALPNYGYYGIRRLFSTTVAQKNALVAAWMMGHAAPKELRMQAVHYAWKREVIRIMDHLPQPGRVVQRTLFDLAE